MTWFENGGQPAPDNWFTRLGDYAQNTFQNPLVQAGIGLATGGPQGMHQGIQNAQNFAQQRQQQQMMPLKMDLLKSQVQAAGREAEMHPLNMAYKKAQAEKLRRDTALGGETPANIREWQAYQRMNDEEKRAYLEMKRSMPWLNTGTAHVQPNPINPAEAPRAVPIDVSGTAAARKAGEHQGGEPQRVEGRTRLDTVLSGVAQDYLDINKSGGIVNPDKGAMDNIVARARSTGVGQFVQGATGSKEQSIRERINNARPLLIQGIMQATGMSARALDSNRELDFYLQAVTDPTKDLHSNLVAIDVLDKTYGLGNVLQRTIPKELYDRVSRDAQRQMQTRPIPTDARGAGSFAAPAGGGWSIRKVD